MTDTTMSQKVTEWLQGVTHKPGWTIKSAGDLRGHPYITIEAAGLPDVHNPGGEFTTSPLWRIPEGITTREQFYDWILDVCIPGIDTHENWEWFRINGKKWRDPHAPGMPAFATDFARP